MGEVLTDAWGHECAEFVVCDTCNGRGTDWGETCIGCGGRGERCPIPARIPPQEPPAPAQGGE